ncbi:protein-glutamate O-methyltransferase CheR [Pleionea sp. CnH1-48]|uniref:CheR family methyltransferase n=1 Tax=Pleionea sp. CnH1-48 TaxID=2954494 RepID=UPI0020975765|nr:CheR family methyltransferase [Pleionea sp. CnH1-48]MCO7224164.1 protein-glutamate O-methyltransferase CheR [Pleionea sp. CnH1-48]
MIEDYQLEELEVSLVLQTLQKCTGVDFSDYAKSSMLRRLTDVKDSHGFANIADFIVPILHQPGFAHQLHQALSITATEAFRFPYAFIQIKEAVIPALKTYPFVKIWHAGCSTGEEVYSLAILLKEEGLLERVQIYATDYNETVLEKAKQGCFDSRDIEKYENNYQQSGGRLKFSDYYHIEGEAAFFDKELSENVLFSCHNLVTDGCFGEMHFILCRNVFIYFNRNLQDRVLGLFYESLVSRGFLCLGDKESLAFSELKEAFEEVNIKARLFRKQPVEVSS